MHQHVVRKNMQLKPWCTIQVWPPCSCFLPLSFALLLIMPTRGSTCRRATDEDEPPMQLQTKYSRRRALMTIDEEEPTPLSKHQKREGSHRPRVGMGEASSSSGQPRDLGSLRGAPPGQSGDPGPGGVCSVAPHMMQRAS